MFQTTNQPWLYGSYGMNHQSTWADLWRGLANIIPMKTGWTNPTLHVGFLMSDLTRNSWKFHFASGLPKNIKKKTNSIPHV